MPAVTFFPLLSLTNTANEAMNLSNSPFDAGSLEGSIGIVIFVLPVIFPSISKGRCAFI